EISEIRVLKPKYVYSRSIYRADPVIRVERDNARRQRFQHGFDIFLSLLQFVGIRFEPFGHLIEIRDQKRKFVLGKNINAVCEISLSDLVRAFGQRLYRRGKAAGDVERRPRRRENKKER